MCELISESKPKARKDYDCMASEWLTNSDFPAEEMSFADKRIWVKARQGSYKIKKGDVYLNQFMKDDGVFTFRAIPEIHALCLKYDLYPEC